MSNSIVFSKYNLPKINENIDNKTVYVRTENKQNRKVIRNQSQITELQNKLYYEKCDEFDRLSSYANNIDKLEDTLNKQYEKGADRIFDRLGVKHSKENLILLTEFLLFDECSSKFN